MFSNIVRSRLSKKILIFTEIVWVFCVPSLPNFMKVSVDNAHVCMFNGMLTSETYIMEPGADHTHATINYNTYD